jgi:hypothetical protein
MDATSTATAPEPDWVGPKGFAARHGGDGIDHDFGMRWGERREQRISLRHLPGTDHGLLFAYDPTWDEYAVLAHDVPQAAVEAAFTQALDIDTHMHVLAFAELVRCHQILLAHAPTGSVVATPVIVP